MSEFDLAAALQISPFARFLTISDSGVQLPSFAAVCCDLKPAMDLWVPFGRWHAFDQVVKHFNLRWRVNAYFDRYSPELDRLPPQSFTTTRAARSFNFVEGQEAHVFIAKSELALEFAFATGWYPLVDHGHVIEKHLADHAKFGDALGYPTCCQRFFRARNNWHNDNTYYAAFCNPTDVPRAGANGLLRHTAFTYAPHMACTFNCSATREYSAKMRDILRSEAPEYAAEIDRRLTTPILCLTERRIFRFEGELHCSESEIRYTAVEAINPTPGTDSLLTLLSQGDRCVIEANIIRIMCKDKQVGAYFARADQHGPEMPFAIQCVQ